jgi:hypothetical protein
VERIGGWLVPVVGPAACRRYSLYIISTLIAFTRTPSPILTDPASNKCIKIWRTSFTTMANASDHDHNLLIQRLPILTPLPRVTTLGAQTWSPSQRPIQASFISKFSPTATLGLVGFSL